MSAPTPKAPAERPPPHPERPGDEASPAPAPGASARVRGWVQPHAHWLGALGLYAALAIALTWPVAASPIGTFFGTPGDATGQIALTEYRADLGVTPLSTEETPAENAPFGLPLPGAVSLPQLAVGGSLQLVRAIGGSSVLAYNLVLLAGLILTPLCAYLLCRHVTGSTGASLVGGLAYGFNPWIIEQAHGHLHFAHLWPLPLMVLGLLMVREGGGRRAWTLLGAASVVALYVHTYFTLFVGAIVVAFVVVEFGGAALARSRRALRAAVARSGFVVAMVVAALIPQGIWLLLYEDRIETALTGTRQVVSDTFIYGSRWWEWVVPSYRHPVFDDWTGPFRGARLHASNPAETSLYVGLTVLALALVGVGVAIVRRRVEPRTARIAALAGVIGLVALVMSLPREIHPLGIGIPTPSWFISGAFDAWRVYARMFAVVDLGVVVLAAIGTTWLLGRLRRSVPARARPRAVAAAAALALGGLVVFDLALDPVTTSAAPPPVYTLAAAQPPGARVEYPLVPPEQARHLLYIFYTEAAERPLMNGGKLESVGGSLNGRLADPGQPWVPASLAALGVRYAVLHEAAYEPGAILPDRGFELVGRESGSALYRVTAAPVELLAVPGDGFGRAEQQPDGRYEQWLHSREGTLAIFNSSDRAVRVELRARVSSFSRPRQLTVHQSGEVLLRRVIDAPTTIRLSALAHPGLTELRLATNIGPDNIGRVLGNGDPRDVSLRFSGVRIDSAQTEPFRLG